MTDKRGPDDSTTMGTTKIDAGGGLAGAKRKFAMNFVLFLGLLLVSYWILDWSESGTAKDSGTTETEPRLPLTELAYLLGEMDALSVHPDTKPPFAEAWAHGVSRKKVEQFPVFADAAPELFDQLTEAYYQGYAGRFDSYFDTTHAREAGYAYGQRFDPNRDTAPRAGGMAHLSRAEIANLLPGDQRALLEQDDMDKAEWMLLVGAFYQGFYWSQRESDTGRRPGWWLP